MRHRRIGSLLVIGLHCFALGCDRGAGGNATASNSTAASAAVSAAPAASNVGTASGGPGDAAGQGANAAERELAPLVSAELPHDVDPAVLERLQKQNKAAEIQALYERFSWQSLVALQWPRDPSGKPAPKPSGPGTPTWMSYKESFLVFQPDGAKPAPWEAPRAPSIKTLTPFMGALPEPVHAKERVLFNVGAKPRRTTADELNQAFTFPLWDQSGNVIHYEILLNRSEFDYLVANELYNLDGQIAFSKRNPGKDLDPSNCNHPNRTVVVMPSGDYGAAEPGAVELKLAWKVLTEKDIPERYIVDEGLIPASIKISGTCAAGNVSLGPSPA